MARVWPFNAADFLQAAQGVAATQWNGLGKADYTVALWAKVNGHTLTDQTFLARYNGIGNILRINPAAINRLGHFWIDSGGAGHEALGATNLTLNVWHHLAARYNSTTKTGDVWLDGNLDGTATAVNPINQAGPAAWRFGLRNTGTNPADATLCEFGFWQQVLTAAEIGALARGCSPLMLGHSIVAYWPTFGPAANEAPYQRQDTSVPLALLTGTLALGAHAPVMWPVPQ